MYSAKKPPSPHGEGGFPLGLILRHFAIMVRICAGSGGIVRNSSQRLATKDEADRLRIAAGAWVLTADQVIADERGRAIELLRIVANPARLRFVEEEMPLGISSGPR